MKMITAYLRPDRVDSVVDALIESGIFAMTISDAVGCGRQRGMVGVYSQNGEDVRFYPKKRLEVAVPDNHVERAMDALLRGARTYHLGDGMVFVLDVTDCMRIRTRVRGAEALEYDPMHNLKTGSKTDVFNTGV